MTDFVYTTGVPNPPNNPSADVGNMQTNTNSISGLIAVDHVGFNGSLGVGGKHQQVQIQSQGSIPPNLSGQQSTLYAKQSGGSQIFFTPGTSGLEYQLTRSVNSGFSSFGQFGNFGTITAGYTMNTGWTFLPGGMLFQYGSVTRGGGISPSTIVVGFPVTFSTEDIVVSITPICKNGGTSEVHTASLQNNTLSDSGFTCNFDSSTSSYLGFTWTAIGV